MKIKSEINKADVDEKKGKSEIIATSISVTNANVFLIADKKGMFLITRLTYASTFLLFD